MVFRVRRDGAPSRKRRDPPELCGCARSRNRAYRRSLSRQGARARAHRAGVSPRTAGSPCERPSRGVYAASLAEEYRKRVPRVGTRGRSARIRGRSLAGAIGSVGTRGGGGGAAVRGAYREEADAGGAPEGASAAPLRIRGGRVRRYAPSKRRPSRFSRPLRSSQYAIPKYQDS
jgi:hypothetical protein